MSSGYQIALLRGINVGKAKRVAMADLRALLESFGWSDVKTLLNSGNVVYRAAVSPAEAGRSIEDGIATRLGVSARVVVITAEELRQAAEENPWQADPELNPSQLLVAVLADDALRSRLEGLTRENWGADQFALGSRVAFLWCAGGILESRLPEAFAKTMGDGVTSRNWATWQKLLAMVAE